MWKRYLILAPILLLGLGAVSYGDGLISSPCLGVFCLGPTSATDGQIPIGSTADGRVHLATITAGTNISITNGNGSITINASGGSGSGCIPPGSSGKVLYDDGAGNCLDTSGVTSNGTKLTFASGALDLAGSGSGDALLNAPATGGGTLTLPAGTDTIAAIAATQTLTNKTISGSNNTLSNIGNSSLTNSSITIAGHSVSLGGTQALACADLSNGATGCSTATGTSGAVIPLLNGANTWSGVQSFTDGDFLLKGSSSGTLTLKCAALCGSNTLTFPAGTTDFSATGGTSQVLMQTSTGAAFTVAQLSASSLSNGTTGSGSVALATSPTLVTPILGVASATTINKVTLTAPATSATLTIANGKTLTASNTLTFSGTDGSSVSFGTGGTVAYTANNLSVFAATTSSQLAGIISDETGTGSLSFATSPTISSPTWSAPPFDPLFGVSVATNGQTLNASCTQSGRILSPAATIAGATFNMCATPTAGQSYVMVGGAHNITTLTISGNGNSIVNSSFSLAAGTAVKCYFNGGDTTWYCAQGW